MRNYLVFLLLLAIPYIGYSQCFEPNGIGNFEGSDALANWYTATEGNGSFELDTTEVQSGSQSLKIELNSASPWQVRLFNRPACYFDLVQGETYTLSLYLKGPQGSSLTATLMNDLTNDVSQDLSLSDSSWTAYSLIFIAQNTSTQGRLKLNFKEVGSYYLDQLSLRRHTTNWYVSPSGSDDLTNGNGSTAAAPLQSISYAIHTAWEPGDTVLVMDGTYRNANYGSGNLNNGPVVNLAGAVGEETGWLIIKNHKGHQPKIEFDGAGGFLGGQQSYLEIAGFEISGPNQAIDYAEAMANRLIQDNYYSGRGIAIWSGHHLNIHHNVIYNCPNSAIRANNADYCSIHHNEVYRNTWWSSNAESALVVAQAVDIDTLSIIKITLTDNIVYDNYNNIPYYNSTYSGETSDYGTAAQDYIIDGSGVYVTRNRDTYFYGWFYFANNLCYGNGINGLVVHKTDRAIVTNNTSYNNGAVPLSSGRQASSGITLNGSAYVRLYNNISWPRLDTDYGYKVYNPADSEGLLASNNLLAKGLSDLDTSQYLLADPLFADTLNRDFRLLASSPAIDAGLNHPDLPSIDLADQARDVWPDLGAYEHQAPDPQLFARVILGGAYESGTGLMRDDLRSGGLIPAADPYQDRPSYLYPIPETSGFALADSVALLATIGPSAIVDWVFLEVRDAIDPAVLIATRPALVTRQGDIVELDGSSPISLPVPYGNYHLTIRHRNHLPVKTLLPLSLGPLPALQDYSNGLNASLQQPLTPNTHALYAGDINSDQAINAADRSATWNDRNQSGYLDSDATLNGRVNAADRSTTWNNRNKMVD